MGANLVHVGVLGDVLIKGAAALVLQAGVGAGPSPATGSHAVTLRTHQKVIKVSARPHSAVIPLSCSSRPTGWRRSLWPP